MLSIAKINHLSARDHWQLLAAFICALTLLIVDEQTQLMGQLRSILTTLVQPIEQIARIPELIINQHNQAINDQANLQHEVNRLRNQVLLLSYEKQQAAKLEQENERLKMLLGVSSQLNKGKLVVSLVVDHAPNPFKQILNLNKGSHDGVSVGMPVMDAHGMMGRIITTSYTESSLMLITDTDAQIPVTIRRTGDRGILQGNGNNDTLNLKFLPSSAQVRAGDLLETSGIDGHYPAGLAVAQITDVQAQAGAIFWKITAQPLAKLNTSREVLIIFPDQPKTNDNTTLPISNNAPVTSTDDQSIKIPSQEAP